MADRIDSAFPRLTRRVRTQRFVLVWAVAWGLVGCLVAAGIVYQSSIDFGPALHMSVLFAEVIGFTALFGARLVFPLIDRLPYLLRFLLQVVTLLSGTIFGSIAVLFWQPLFIVAQGRTAALIVLVNAALGVIVGIALNTYDGMRRQIENSYRTLREKEALDRELSIARDVQQQLLPRSAPQIRGLELAGVCLPAVGVGGDYFDYLPLSDDQVGLVVADVSGKGIPAALMMAGLQASVRSLTLSSHEPADLTRQLNEILFASSTAARYATMVLGFYDGPTRSFHYSNAGHQSPLVVHGDQVERLDCGGMPIGMFGKSQYLAGRHSVRPGDLLTLFTDGVTETPGPRGEEFGEGRLIELIRRDQAKPLDEVIATVLDALRSWSNNADPHDDVTLVLARVR